MIEKLMDIASGFREAKVLLTGAELGVFDRVAGAGRDAGSVASDLRCDPRGVEILLDALVAMGLLQKQEGIYRNVPEYELLLTSSGKGEFLGMLRHQNRLFRNWAFLEERVRGGPLPDALGGRGVLTDPQTNENFIKAMYAFGSRNAPAVVDEIDLRGVRTLADLGGGPGHYTAEFARRSPSLEPYLIDLPLTLKVARSIQAGSPVFERIRFVEWDFYNSDPPAGLPLFDLVFISAVLHAESPERNREFLARVFPLVAPGGRVVIQENMVDPDRTSPREAALFAINMLTATEAGRTYTEKEIASWGAAAGFKPEPARQLGPRSRLLDLRKPDRGGRSGRTEAIR